MNRRGVTLIEMLITVIIGSIAMLAFAVPFSAERIFWNKGKRQAEAQRDAQLALRAMARVGRESPGYTIETTTDSVRVKFTIGSKKCFDGFPVSLNPNKGQLFFNPGCEVLGGGVPLIDGVRSRLEEMTAEEIIANRLLRVRLRVSHRLETTDLRQPEDEILETEIFLRNGT